MSDLVDRLTSRKFLLALAAVIYTVIQVSGGAMTANDGMTHIQIIIAAFMASEGLADAAGRLKPSIPTDPAPTPAALAATVSPAPTPR